MAMQHYKDTKFDVIIQAGQSNAEGIGLGAATRPYEPNDDILYFDENGVHVASERPDSRGPVNNFSLAFARNYVESGLLKKGRKLLVIRAAVGGTGFLDKRWGMQDDLFLRMIGWVDEVKSVNKDNRFVAFIWHQGETDAILSASYETHLANLSTLLSAVRTRCDVAELPFIAGSFVREWHTPNATACAPVLRAIREVCGTVHAGFVETDDLESNNEAIGDNDVIHFSREAQNILGDRYFAAFQAIRK